jgi:hypothetical protein
MVCPRREGKDVTTLWPFAGSLLSGALCSTTQWPYTLHARCCDLRPRFRVKHSMHSGCRAIARNGRILLCADRPVEELFGRIVRLRLQTWHRIYLPGESPQPHGLLLCLRCLDGETDTLPLFEMFLRPYADARGELCIEVGGGMMLDFYAAN